MSTKQFAAGDQVYDIHGRAGSYVASANGGHLVEPIYEDDEFAPHYASVETWREVFGTPPTERLHADVAEVERELVSAQARLDALRSDQRALEVEISAARKRIVARPDLVDLDLWLQDKVTHIVSLEYSSIRIGTVEETLRKEDRDRELRLLSLMVDPKANRFWTGYAMYSDGSSSQTRCLLATSLEHARERAADYIRQEVKRNPGQSHAGFAASAIRYGVEISDELRQQAEQMEATAAKRAVEQASETVKRAQADLAVAQARAAALGGVTA